MGSSPMSEVSLTTLPEPVWLPFVSIAPSIVLADSHNSFFRVLHFISVQEKSNQIIRWKKSLITGQSKVTLSPHLFMFL